MLKGSFFRVLISVLFTITIIIASTFINCDIVTDLLNDDDTTNADQIKKDTSLMQLPVLGSVEAQITGIGDLNFSDGMKFTINNFNGGNGKGVLIDIKGMFTPDDFKNTKVIYWRL